MNIAEKFTSWTNNNNAWIEGKNTWVDIGYVPTRYTKAEFEFCLLGPAIRYRSNGQPNTYTTEAAGTPDLIIGHMGTSDSNDWRIATGSDRSWFIDSGSARATTSEYSIEKNIWYKCIVGPQCKFEIDGRFLIQSSFYGSLANSNIKLFSESPTCTSSNTSGFYAWLGFKYVKIFENDVLIMDLVPLKKNNIACFYDKISTNSFFGLNDQLIIHN